MSSITVSVKEMGSNDIDEYAFSGEARIIDLLEEAGFNTENVVVRRNGKIVTEEEALEDSDEIELVPVVSGG
ncbi:MAG: MoaD/ThiS family protein [Hadesarchaea archaeon]|nr:MoaD/ThiS family protein [Hadesarchaea archaeon]